MAYDDIQASGDVLDFTEYNALIAGLQSHSNTWHSDNYYYQESDLTSILNDNYHESGVALQHQSITSLSSQSISGGNIKTDDITSDSNLDINLTGTNQFRIYSGSTKLFSIYGDNTETKIHGGIGYQNLRIYTNDGTYDPAIFMYANADESTSEFRIRSPGTTTIRSGNQTIFKAGDNYISANTGLYANFISANTSNLGELYTGGSGQNYGYTYLIYKDGANYKAQDGTDGSVDSTNANANANVVISYALDACRTAGGGDVVLTDIFTVTGLVFNNHDNVTLRGLGWHTGLVFPDAGTVHSMIHYSSSVNNQVKLLNMSLDGNGRPGRIINSYGKVNVGEFTGLYIHGQGAGIGVALGRDHYVDFHDNLIMCDNANKAFDAVAFYPDHGSFHNNIIHQSAGTGDLLTAALSRHVSYIGNTLRNSTGTLNNGIFLESNLGNIRDYVIANNTLDACSLVVRGKSGATYPYSAQRINIIDNIIYSGGNLDLRILKSGDDDVGKIEDIICQGNFISGNVLIQGMRDIKMYDNFIYGDVTEVSSNVNIQYRGNEGYPDSTWAFISAQSISGQLLALHKSRDISSWDSSAFTNSGLLWNGSNWVAMPSGGSGGGVSTISNLTIDADKDWDSKGIHNLSYLSSSTISGGHITTGYSATTGNDVVNKTYFDANNTSGSGQNYAYDYTIYKQGSIYYAQKGTDGSLPYSDSDFSTLLQQVVDLGECKIFLPSGVYNTSGTIYVSDRVTLQGSGKGTRLYKKDNSHIFVLSGTLYSHIKDLWIDLPNDFESDIFRIVGTDGATSSRYNIIENISIDNESHYNSGTCIHCYASGTGGNVFSNTFSDIKCDKYTIGTGILLQSYESGPWINGNNFEHIWFWGMKNGIEFDVPHTRGTDGNGANGNYFADIKNEYETNTECGFKNICGSQNFFVDTRNWDTSDSNSLVAIYSIHPSSSDTNIMSLDNPINYYWDSGLRTRTMWGGWGTEPHYPKLGYNAQVENILGVPEIHSIRGDSAGMKLYANSGGSTQGFRFYTRNANDDLDVERLSIASEGNIVNTTFYSSNIRIMNTKGTIPLSITRNTSTATPIRIRNNTWYWDIGLNSNEQFTITCSGVTQPFRINDDFTPTNTLYLMSSSGDLGRVGINTDSPDYTFDVNGSIYATSLSSQSISGGTIISNIITTTGRISSATGIYADWISGNNTNLVGASNYLLDNADDETSGTLTAKSFVGPISSTSISGGAIKSESIQTTSTYTIYKQSGATNYNLKRNVDNIVISSGTDFSNLMQYGLSQFNVGDVQSYDPAAHGSIFVKNTGGNIVVNSTINITGQRNIEIFSDWATLDISTLNDTAFKFADTEHHFGRFVGLFHDFYYRGDKTQTSQILLEFEDIRPFVHNVRILKPDDSYQFMKLSGACYVGDIRDCVSDCIKGIEVLGEHTAEHESNGLLIQNCEFGRETSDYGIKITDGTHIVVRDCWLEGCVSGMIISGTTGGTGITIKDNYIQSTHIGLVIDAPNVTVAGNKFMRDDTGGNWYDAVIIGNRYGGQYIYNHLFVNSNDATMFLVRGGGRIDNSIIAQNQFMSEGAITNAYFISSAGSIRDSVIANNVILSNTSISDTSPILLNSATVLRNNIVGNTVYNYTTPLKMGGRDNTILSNNFGGKDVDLGAYIGDNICNTSEMKDRVDRSLISNIPYIYSSNSNRYYEYYDGTNTWGTKLSNDADNPLFDSVSSQAVSGGTMIGDTLKLHPTSTEPSKTTGLIWCSSNVSTHMYFYDGSDWVQMG